MLYQNILYYLSLLGKTFCSWFLSQFVICIFIIYIYTWSNEFSFAFLTVQILTVILCQNFCYLSTCMSPHFYSLWFLILNFLNNLDVWKCSSDVNFFFSIIFRLCLNSLFNSHLFLMSLFQWGMFYKEFWFTESIIFNFLSRQNPNLTIKLSTKLFLIIVNYSFIVKNICFAFKNLFFIFLFMIHSHKLLFSSFLPVHTLISLISMKEWIKKIWYIFRREDYTAVITMTSWNLQKNGRN